MNFFQSQAQARGHSRRLVVLFALAVAAIVAAVNAVVLVAIAFIQNEGRRGDAVDPTALSQHSPQVIVTVTLIVVGIVGLASLLKMMKLSAGGPAVARSLGATPLAARPKDARHTRLRNVVEEIAIASGVAVPQVYVLEGEQAINAFAAGFSPADAAVTVTQGALEKLSRDELQGVIAHEFSHIVNGDMRLSIRLMGVTFGILVIALIARGILRHARGGRKNGGAIILAALAIMLIGYIGVFFARLIKAGFSRQRESLADASAVQFTRQTQGLAGALKKIAGVQAGSHLHSARTEEVSHMLFGEGLKLSSLFATHPPLGARIKALEPTFDMKQVPAMALKQGWNDPGYAPEDLALSVPIAGFAPSASAAAPRAPAGLIAQPGPQHYHYAEALRAAIPDALAALAREPATARHVILALLLDAEAGTRQKQLVLVGKSQGDANAGAVAVLWPKLEGLDPGLRLPLAELAFPALRAATRAELLELVALISRLTNVDGGVSMLEFCLGRMVRTLVADALKPARAAVAGRLKLAACEADVARLLSALAEHGSEDAAAARRSYLAGLSQALPQSGVKYQPGQPWPAVLDAALRHLDELQGPGKELLLEALMKTASHDGRITVGEAELLRVVCASLHCPLPPLMA
jgi:Zn-dependent protease with chaperone function